MKNGPHCAFAHGPLDLRQPVYDVRELQAIEKEETDIGQTGIENNKAVLEDPRWQGLCSTVRCFMYTKGRTCVYEELLYDFSTAVT